MAAEKKRIEKKVSLMIGGKKVRKSFYGYSESEIYQKIAAFSIEAEKGRLFSQVSDAWQQEHFEEISFGTIQSYKPAIARAEKEFDGYRISDIRPIDIQRVLGNMKKERYSAQTARVFLSVVNQICSFAVLAGDINTNPASEVKLPKGMPKTRRDVPPDHILDIISRSYDKPNGLLPYFLLYTGCRIGEALGLQWKDIDFSGKTISINKSVFYMSNQPSIKEPKTSAGVRQIILLDRLAEKLLPMKGAPDHYVFSNGPEPLSKQAFKRRWQAYCFSVGLATPQVKIDGSGKKQTTYKTDFTAHQLRHAFATILFEAGISEKDAQQLMGHSKISVTHDIYTHIRQSHMDDTASKLNSFVG